MKTMGEMNTLDALIADLRIAPKVRERLANYKKTPTQLNLDIADYTSDSTVKIIKEILSQKNVIDYLAIGFKSWIDDEELSELIKCIQQNKSNINSLILNFKQMGDKSIIALQELIASIQVERINLYSNSLNDEHIDNIIEILVNKFEVKKIAFNGDKLTYASLIKLFDYQHFARLEEIFISGSSFDERACAQIAENFPQMPHLKQIMISASDISQTCKDTLCQIFNKSEMIIRSTSFSIIWAAEFKQSLVCPADCSNSFFANPLSKQIANGSNYSKKTYKDALLNNAKP